MHTVKTSSGYVTIPNAEFDVYIAIKNSDELNDRLVTIANTLASKGVVVKLKNRFEIMNEDIIANSVSRGTFDFIGGRTDKDGIAWVRDVDGGRAVHSTNKEIDSEIAVFRRPDGVIGIVGVFPEYSITTDDVLTDLLKLVLQKYPNVTASRILSRPTITWLKSEGVIK